MFSTGTRDSSGVGSRWGTTSGIAGRRTSGCQNWLIKFANSCTRTIVYLLIIAKQFEVAEGTVHSHPWWSEHVLSCSMKISGRGALMTAVRWLRGSLQIQVSLITCDENWVYCYDRETVPSGKPKKAKQRRSIGKLMIIPFFDSKSIIYIHWVPHMARQSTKSMRQVRDFIWHLHLDNALLQQNYPSDQLLGWYGHQDCPSSSLQSRLKPTLLLYF